MQVPIPVGELMCQLGIHKFRVIEVKFGFGSSGKVEIVECERCAYVTSRIAK